MYKHANLIDLQASIDERRALARHKIYIYA